MSTPQEKPAERTPGPHTPPLSRTLLPLLLVTGASSPLLTATAQAQDYVGNGQATISDGNWDSVYGLKGQPRTGDATAEHANVTITGGSISGNVYGGYANSTNGAALAGSNRVTITGMNGTPLTLYGGYALSSTGIATASANSLNISGATLSSGQTQAFGGYATSRGATGGRLLATNNRVNLDLQPTDALDLVVGGRSRAEQSAGTAAATYGNRVTIAGGQVTTLYGGYSTAGSSAESTGNTLIISGSQIQHTVGGEAFSSSQQANADNNTITIDGGTYGDIIGASVQSDTGQASASNNSVYIRHATVTSGVTGGLSTNTNSAPATLNSNSIVVGAGAIIQGDVHGGDANQPSTSGDYSASYNTIAVVEGGQVDGEIVGGNLEGSGNASRNTIVVNNGRVNGDIIGGRTAAGGSSTGNSIIIGQQARLHSAINLLGGEVGGQVVNAQGSGNTLIIDNWQGTVQRAAGFANLHFVLPAPGTVASDVPMLTVSAAKPNDFEGTTVTAQLPDIITGGRAHIGETFELVHDNTGAITKASTGNLISMQQGYTTLYDGVIQSDNDSIYIRIDSSRPNPQAGALTEARIGTAGLLNQGSDLLAGNALCAADCASRGTKSWSAFATFYGGAADLTTESDITTRGMSLVTGLAHQSNPGKTCIITGAFFEMGFGNMSTDRDTEQTSISGSGDAHYSGGGIFARLGITCGHLRGLYIEASGRAGEATTSWSSGDLRDNMNRPAAYDISSAYGGGHIGIGYTIAIKEAWSLDLFSKYLFLHQNGCDTTINGEKIRFSPVDSSRMRCGARLTGKILPTAAVYAGAAWEHEFLGKARGNSESSNMTIPSTSMEGNSALMELGIAVCPESLPIHLDFAIEGAAGTRQSIGGRAQILIKF